MASLVAWLGELASGLARLAVDGRRCCRIRSPLSTCRRCLEVCPTGGINWAGGQLRLGRCLECGLCAAVCPTEALRLQEPAEPALLGKVQNLVAAQGRAVIACERQLRRGRERGALCVPCLGALSVKFLLALRPLEGRVEFAHVEELCRNCEAGAGAVLFARRRSYLAMCRTPPGPAAPAAAAAGVSRRAVLQAAWSGLRRFLAEAVGARTTATGAGGGARVEVATKKKLYLLAGGPLALPDLYPLPAGAGKCTFCGACARLCPVEALRQVENTTGARLELDPAACVSCGLCAEVCFYGNLRLVPAVEAIRSAEVIVLEEGTRSVCRNCGAELFTARPGAPCAACAGRADFLAAVSGR